MRPPAIFFGCLQGIISYIIINGSVFCWNWLEARFFPAAAADPTLKRVATWKIARTVSAPLFCLRTGVLSGERERMLDGFWGGAPGIACCAPRVAGRALSAGYCPPARLPAALPPCTNQSQPPPTLQMTFHLGDWEDEKEEGSSSDGAGKDASHHDTPAAPPAVVDAHPADPAAAKV